MIFEKIISKKVVKEKKRFPFIIFDLDYLSVKINT